MRRLAALALMLTACAPSGPSTAELVYTAWCAGNISGQLQKLAESGQQLSFEEEEVAGHLGDCLENHWWDNRWPLGPDGEPGSYFDTPPMGGGEPPIEK